MGKHSGGSAKEPTTDQGKPFDQMTGAEKAAEFDASHSNPAGYAARNFSDENQGKNGRKPKHG
ncbi:hypothetical protein SEA_DENNEBES_60 [Streptomyces phage Dennebes]|jgi:hypothetical protein|nr:hypothetical protein SEA_DENNEBES_60 [Streptomyces phage Dennebes]